jgi:hypothetical protein
MNTSRQPLAVSRRRKDFKNLYHQVHQEHQILILGLG